MKGDNAILLDVAEAARLAHQFAQEVEDRQAFKENRLVRSAMLHQLEPLLPQRDA